MRDSLHMPANLAIDGKLIEEACRLGQHKTKKQAVPTAVEEYIQHRRQDQILEDFGASISIRITITRPSVAESEHEGPGRYAHIALGGKVTDVSAALNVFRLYPLPKPN